MINAEIVAVLQDALGDLMHAQVQMAKGEPCSYLECSVPDLSKAIAAVNAPRPAVATPVEVTDEDVEAECVKRHGSNWRAFTEQAKATLRADVRTALAAHPATSKEDLQVAVGDHAADVRNMVTQQAVPDAWIKAFRRDVDEWPNHYLSQRLAQLLDMLAAAPLHPDSGEVNHDA